MTTKQAKEKIEKAGGKWEDFIDYMFCSAHGIDEKGEPNWYDWDVEMFVVHIKY